MVIAVWVCFGLIGLTTGLLSGLLGIGGNILAVPAMFYVLKYFLAIPPTNAMYITLGTCMTTMVFTSLSAVRGHFRNNHINLKFFYNLAPYMLIGSVLGVVLATMIKGVILEKIFGIFLVIAAINICMTKEAVHSVKITELTLSMNVIFGLIIGFCSGLLGIGGGSLLIPLMIYLNYSGKMISGTTSVCSLAMAIMGTGAFIIKGLGHHLGAVHTVGFIYIPAVIIMVPLTYLGAKFGVSWSMTMSNINLKRIFVILLFSLGIYMLS